MMLNPDSVEIKEKLEFKRVLDAGNIFGTRRKTDVGVLWSGDKYLLEIKTELENELWCYAKLLEINT